MEIKVCDFSDSIQIKEQEDCQFDVVGAIEVRAPEHT
jgi:hypothetical protein